MNQRDPDRLELLDRIADRVPELDLDRERIEWTALDCPYALKNRKRHGAEALIVNGGGFDGGDGAFFVNHGADLHAVGLLDPVVPG